MVRPAAVQCATCSTTRSSSVHINADQEQRLAGPEDDTVPSVASEDYHRGPVQSLLQNRRSLPPVAEDWNLSHGVRFYWDSFLVTPHNSTVGR